MWVPYSQNCSQRVWHFIWDTWPPPKPAVRLWADPTVRMCSCKSGGGELANSEHLQSYLHNRGWVQGLYAIYTLFTLQHLTVLARLFTVRFASGSQCKRNRTVPKPCYYNRARTTSRCRASTVARLERSCLRSPSLFHRYRTGVSEPLCPVFVPGSVTYPLKRKQ